MMCREDLSKNPHVVVATPGRAIDMIGAWSLQTSSIKTVILDEADEMLSQGFLESIQTILRSLPKTSQIGLFSPR